MAPDAHSSSPVWAFASTTLLLLIAIPSHATLIDLGVVTRDSDQGIDWLDTSESVGLSVTEALALYPSWEVATATQVCGFVVQAVEPGPWQVCGGSEQQFSGLVPPWGTMFDLLGPTFHDGNDVFGIDATYVFSGDTLARNVWAVAILSGTFKILGADADTGAPETGIFLVRPIPEPSTAILVCAGLVALCASQHGERRRQARSK